ncbi:formyltetrahydrofolate deformylase [Sunxiuqinia elliptica]|uniref:Formyltetrahydrofolate deformylase n=1 Tax=Sunxiuqinia elliptica TaxID=655355 RepID=A0A1I2FGK4_9BACT|nr:formyltetrahydrofolate deformylase [Sunxiuqinia elliptica]TDO05170.1 formyltetrahydrofolate deformylase [Sunxiuqinia elliptica]TDO64719.1 formyltetrahydrofolate deformylase [Sunxiuqinia elliptica]SFF03656.1 formyltetrahydrofolate deformylase [Sunxiuqinia elliptica]
MKSIKPLREKKDTAILLIHCPDQQGILATVTEFLNKNNGNIMNLDQHVDRVEKIFYMRVEWELKDFSIPADKIGEYFDTLIASKLNMNWKIYFSEDVPRMAIFVSKMSHCLFDILARYTAGEWDVEIPLIISNHETMRPVAERFGIDFHYFPVNNANKEEQEAAELELLKEHQIDFIVLARYMQILSADFVDHYPNRIINIHHSFLPAFAGAKPYHAAHARGVKIIGATSHYVTSDLDAGPIIDQGVTRCSHVDTVKSLIRKGRDLEKIVLSNAVFKHLQRKVLVYNNRTVVFH